MKKRILSAILAGVMALSMTACGSKEATDTAATEAADAAAATEAADAESEEAAEEEATGEDVVIKMTWWGGQTRHDQTQQICDLYTESHPNVTFELSPSGWDGYFEKLSTQAASGAMPDIVQMDYLYLTTYAKNNSLADLQQFIDDGTIDVSGIDQNLLNTGSVDGKMPAVVLTTSMINVGYNTEVLAEAGVEEPTGDWTWSDFVEMNQKVYDATGKYGVSMNAVADTNIFNYWVRQHGASLFSEDNKSLGYEDDQICADFFAMWKGLMDADVMPNPDEFAQIETLGQEAGPVVTGDGAMTMEWNNYASKLSTVSSSIKMVTPPLSDDSDNLGLWMKPGMFMSIAETSTVKKEAAEFINWMLNSEEANDIMLGERGTPAPASVREHLVASGKLGEQQIAMFEGVDTAAALCGATPAPDPVGMAEVNEVFKNAGTAVFYGQMTPEEAAKDFREKAIAVLSVSN
ncbi:MAG: extracellular solute-binding protein [Lachnospiraceae bacterium]|nr:extracellular solute-binding protein [Lachnospiraceae bacterium]